MQEVINPRRPFIGKFLGRSAKLALRRTKPSQTTEKPWVLFVLVTVIVAPTALEKRAANTKKGNQPSLAGSLFNFHGERGGSRTRDL